MDKVIVERPRRGSRNNNDDEGQRKAAQRDARTNYESSPRRESSSRYRRKEWKEFNEHLTPLFRYLLKNVGRPWDKVHGEIRQRINPKSTVQMHIMQHLQWYVARDVIEVVRNKHFTDGKGDRIRDSFLVHPRTGLLMKNLDSHDFGGCPWLRGPYWPRTPKFIMREDKTYKQINDVWYEVTLEPIPDRNPKIIDDRPPLSRLENESIPAFDVVIRKIPTYGQVYDTWGRYIHATTKRQISGREIKRLKLNEDKPQLPDVLA